MKKRVWIFVMVSSLLLIGFLTLPRWNIGIEKFAIPSLSIQESQRKGVFVESPEILIQSWEEDSAPVEITQIWTEKIVERYEAIPVAKRVVGQRVCVGLKNTTGKNLVQDLYLYTCNNEVAETRGVERIFSEDQAAFVLDQTLLDTTEEQQTLCLATIDGKILVRFTLRFALPK